MKKAISLGVAAAMAATLLAGCGTAASSASAATSEAASTADSTAASSEVTASETHEINTTDPIGLTISWWGGDSRHEAYQKALEAFHEKYPQHHRFPHLRRMVRLGREAVHRTGCGSGL